MLFKSWSSDHRHRQREKFQGYLHASFSSFNDWGEFSRCILVAFHGMLTLLFFSSVRKTLSQNWELFKISIVNMMEFLRTNLDLIQTHSSYCVYFNVFQLDIKSRPLMRFRLTHITRTRTKTGSIFFNFYFCLLSK